MKKGIFFFVITIIIISCKIPNANSNKALLVLGKQLFYERALSANNTKSCASCHHPKYAFTDGYKQSIGAYGDILQHNSRPLFNLTGNPNYTYTDSTLHTLIQQMQHPMYNTKPPELGINGMQLVVEKRIQQNLNYKQQFAQQHLPITMASIQAAIAAYISNITSYNAPYDKFIAGDSTLLTTTQKQGLKLFYSTRTNCSSCHGGGNFNTPTYKNMDSSINYYYNTGLYNSEGKNNYATNNLGLQQHTGNPKDNGRYNVPTLRNLGYTAPYYHNGSEPSLLQVLQNYNQGGRILPNSNGVTNKLKHLAIKPLGLNKSELLSLYSFLQSLNDSTIVTQ